MKNFEVLLRKYAELVVKVGVNVQPGQVLIVHAPIETSELARLIVAKAYEAGAKYVLTEWDDDAVTRARFENAADDSFDYYPQWLADGMVRFAEEGGAILHIKVPNPDLYQGIDSGKVSRAVKAAAVARKVYEEQQNQLVADQSADPRLGGQSVRGSAGERAGRGDVGSDLPDGSRERGRSGRGLAGAYSGAEGEAGRA